MVSPTLLQVPTSIDGFLAQYGGIVVDFAITVVTFVVTFLLLYRIGKSVLVRAVKRGLNARQFSSAVVSLGSSIAAVIAVLGAVAIAATVSGFPAILSAFATIAGALALGVAFAAGDIIENFVAGIFILKDKPFTVGDYIEWDGNNGIVREINLRVSKLDTFNNEQITVPNGDLASAVVMNPVANDTRRLTFDFGIEYDASMKDAREIIVDEATKIEGVLEEPTPSAPVTGLADSAVVLNGRLWINPAETGAGGVKNQWIENVKRRFDAEGIGMPYPYTELTGEIDVNTRDVDAAPADD
ncbi:mechanosensitive ion channel family protein [Halonotius terrestris]|uniref:mechanosensitive ion channel family protein n=1 Tax=Halonotius terrestris TaxID=2487750 RepID=UPI00163B725C|nr:mechanosensitive ion channel domain-containing protein [Halonotius terrestris]